MAGDPPLPLERKLTQMETSTAAGAGRVRRKNSAIQLLSGSPPPSNGALPLIAVSAAHNASPVQPATPAGAAGTGAASEELPPHSKDSNSKDVISSSKAQLARTSAASIGEAERETPPASAWFALRIGPAARSSELCRTFGLAGKEVLLDDFNCALRKKVLLQGRLYVFDHYVCFSSSLFGQLSKKVVIPLEHVTAVRKKTNLRIPNSIRIDVAVPNAAPASFFFTSFLSRDDAYQLIDSCWTQCRARRQQHQEASSEERFSFPTSQLDTSASNSHAKPLSSGTNALPPRSGTHGGADDDDDDEEGDASGSGVWSTVTSGPVPPHSPDSHVVVQAVLDGAPRDLFDMLLADDSHMLEDFLDSQGNRRMMLARWKHEVALLGHVRDFQFISPIKGAFANWGVPHTECIQSHRFRRFEGDHLVFESSQTMTSIPYGDCFTVDMRWDVTPLPPADLGGGLGAQDQPPQMQLTIRARTPFSRKCLFKKVIESGAVKQVKDTYSLLVEQLRGNLAQLVRDRQPVQLGSAATPGLPLKLTSALGSSTRLLGSPQHPDAAAAALGDGSDGELAAPAAGGGAGVRAGRRYAASASAPGAAQAIGGSGAATPSPAGRPFPWHERLRRGSLAFFARSIIIPTASVSTMVADRLGGFAGCGDSGPQQAASVAAQAPVSPVRQSPTKFPRVQSGAALATVGSVGYRPAVGATSPHAAAGRRRGQGGARGWLLALLALLVLGVQLAVLALTLQHHQRVSGGGTVQLPLRPTPVVAAEGGGSLDTFLATTREMWQRRATLLEAELRLAQEHAKALESQVSLAHMYAGGAS